MGGLSLAPPIPDESRSDFDQQTGTCFAVAAEPDEAKRVQAKSELNQTWFCWESQPSSVAMAINTVPVGMWTSVSCLLLPFRSDEQTRSD